MSDAGAPFFDCLHPVRLTIDQIVEYVQRLFPNVVYDFNWGERAL